MVLWGKQAETLQQYLLRGRQIYVEGRLQTRQWDDRDGNKRYTTEVRSDRVVLLGGRGGQGDRSEAADSGHTGPRDRRETPGDRAPAPPAGDASEVTEDDIPF